MTEAPRRQRRDQTVELLRVVSAFGIVVFHAKAPGAEAGYAGLIVFVLLAMAFDTMARGTVRSAAVLADRLLLPFVVWSLIYGGKNWFMDGAIYPGDGPIWLKLLAGPAGHLWFLPFIFFALVINNHLKTRISSRIYLIFAGALGLAVIGSATFWRSLPLEAPLQQWAHALAAVLIGVAIGAGWRDWKGATTVIAGVCALLAVWIGADGVAIPYALGIVLVLAALWLPSLPINMAPVSSCMLGVYLLHLAVLGVVGRFTPVDNLWAAALVFIICLAAVFASKRVLPTLTLFSHRRSEI